MIFTRHRCLRTMVLGLVAASFILVLPSAVSAQSVVVAKFKGKAKKSAKNTRKLLIGELNKQGASIVSYGKYLRVAKKSRVRGKRATKPAGIRKVAGRMGVDAVVTGFIKRKGRSYFLYVKVFDSGGERIAKKTYRLRKGRWAATKARGLAQIIVGSTGGEAELEEAADPLMADSESIEPPPTVVEEEVPDATGDVAATEPTAEKNESFLPPWARTDANTETAAAAEAEAPAEEVSKPAPRRKRKRRGAKTGAVSDILIAVGGSGNLRAGLSPRHESDIYPGVRADMRIFMGSFLDLPVVRDIGVGGMFNMGLGLKYGMQGGEDDWDASMMQWQGELNYRLAFNDVPMAPAFIVRGGYGSTSCTIDSPAEAAKSAAYAYPYAALDIYVMLYDPMLRFFVSGGFLFSVAASEEVEGTGMGFTARGGLDVNLFDTLHLAVGYEMMQFFGIQIAGEDTSDTYQTFFLRTGWNFQ